MVRIAAAIISAEPLGSWASTLRNAPCIFAGCAKQDRLNGGSQAGVGIGDYVMPEGNQPY
jgi:hypothetical protein